MKSFLAFFMLVQVTVLSASTNYVKSDDSSPLSCPGQPCLTLGQYNQQIETYFSTGSTFVFLAGNHTINTTVNLTSISEITLRGERNTQVIILFSVGVGFLCENVSNLSIEGLAFLSGYMAIQTVALKIIDSNGVWIHNVGFQRSYSFSKHFTGLHITFSDTITVTSCSFEGNTAYNGGAIYVTAESNLTLNASTFIGNNATRHGGAIYASGSNLSLSDNMFSGNTAGNGGAMYVKAESSVTISDTAFTHNKAVRSGGAIYSTYSIVNIYGSSKNSSIVNSGGYCRTCDMITTIPKSIPYEEVIMELNEALCATHFTNNTAILGGAMSMIDSTVLFSGSVIMFRYNSANASGGALYSSRNFFARILNFNRFRTVTNVHHLFFVSNRALSQGGSIFMNFQAENGSLYFLCNSAHRGGAIYSRDKLWLSGSSYFIANRASWGGAIEVEGSFDTFTLTGHALFSENNATYGGAIVLNGLSNNISGKINFINNTAEEGGALFLTDYNINTNIKGVDFVNNTAHSIGGGILIRIKGNIIFKTNILIQLCQFISNTAGSCGGAIYIEGINVFLDSISAIGNSNSALCIFQSRVNISGRTKIYNNIGTQGGGIKVTRNSYLNFKGRIMFDCNKAELGGAIYLSFEINLFLNGNMLFSSNTADRDGGAIYAQQTNITFANNSSFMYNTAENGGAVYLNTSFLILNRGVNLSISYNHATKYGGGIYHEDNIASASQCNYEKSTKDLSKLPYCFLVSRYYGYSHLESVIHSQNNSADINGKLLYGGLLDRCQPMIKGDYQEDYNTTSIPLLKKFRNEVQSQPYRLCFCENVTVFNCSSMKSIEIYPRQKFYLSLIAFDQLNPTSTNISATTTSSRLANASQRSQMLQQGCSKLSYNLYPWATDLKNSNKLSLYVNEGFCNKTDLGMSIVNVAFRQCPHGFKKSDSGDECVCDDILKAFGPTACTIDDNVIITKLSNGTGSEFWVQAWYENETYQGIIGYKTCPRDYCKKGEVTLSLDNPDTQCALSRSGLLCGECATNHSLMLGSSRCHVCHNTYLSLLLPFAAAGIALVVFLSILRLTVATGMINSVILYANFVQINRSIFLPTDSTRNILTVFIAWLNLDLGLETCFYDGMTAYAQTWLQFAFPLYLWMLMGLIIVTCRYSVTLSKLIGHNPIAVLATLLLMSYNKVLKIMIDVYSFTPLDFPQQNTRLVWLKDANVVFVGSEHLLLTVVTSLVLVFIFLPYTLLLLLGYKLYGFSGRKGLRWLNRLKPLLDSYYAPYNTHTRYWTGFLLLVRCVLYSVFSLGDTHKSLVSIIITFTVLVGVTWISSKVYISRIANTVEVSVYLNLVILSAVSSNNMVSAKLFNTLVALVFVTMLGIIIYHLHLLYIAQSAMWTKMKDWMKHIISKPHMNPPPDTEVTSPPHNVPSTSVIELREPLLSLDNNIDYKLS